MNRKGEESVLIKAIRKAAFYIFLAWTALIIFSFLVIDYYRESNVVESAAIEARTHSDLNMFYRKVVAGFGGIYVSMENVEPNPYLDLPNRDVTTRDGQKLTLVNPAYMTRLVFEYIRSSSERPVLNKITSLKIINPVNTPDPWERKVLISFDKGQREAQEVTEIDGVSYLRLMRPFFVEQSCLKCHASQGYRVGDIRGGMSISVPLDPYYKTGRKVFGIILVIHSLIWLTVSACILAVAAIAVKKARVYEETRLLSLSDPLTGMANRRFAEIDLKESFEMAKRYGTAFSVIMADLDEFKKYNDTNGHAAGDRLLRDINRIILKELRQTDLLARYGGEEFLIVLHQTGINDALTAAERIRAAVEAESDITLSLGVSSFRKGISSKEEIVNEADKALYAAKQNGRNRAEVFGGMK